MIDISRADKVEVLLRLFNAGHGEQVLREKFKARPDLAETAIGMRRELEPMTREQAQRLVASGDLSFDYLGARKFPVDLNGDTFDEWLYDRDNGEGTARRALDGLTGVRFL